MSTEAQNTGLEVVKKDISSLVMKKIDAMTEAGELLLPKDFAPQNALKAAYFKLTENLDGKGALIDKCDKASVAEALYKMVVYGLSAQKNQCYLIAYGTKLTLHISYMGNLKTAKQYNPHIAEIKARAITKGEDFEFKFQTETGKVEILKHMQTLESIGSKDIIGAYSLIYYKDGSFEVGDIMNFEQIRQSWNQGAMKGGSPAHKNFPDEMSKRTVINRTCKRLINTSSDAILMDDELLDEELPTDTAKVNLKVEKEKYANAKVIEFEELQQPEEAVNDIPADTQTDVDAEKTTTDQPNF
jgi:recombination protein RecT